MHKSVPKLILLGVAMAGMFAGCASPYKVTLTSGSVMTSKSKPKLDKATDVYTLTDIQGRTIKVPSFRIRQIEPLSRGYSEEPKFKSLPVR